MYLDIESSAFIHGRHHKGVFFVLASVTASLFAPSGLERHFRHSWRYDHGIHCILCN